MMRYANYTNSGLKTDKPGYEPILDPRAAFLFYPPHCFAQTEFAFDSPIIAYIKQGNQIEEDLITQLNELFTQ
jgi:hypothetical protein